MAQVSVNITSEDLQKSARKYRKELLQMPVLGLSRSLQHMTLRPGIRYAETVGELSGDMQFGPYSETREDNSEVVINPRTCIPTSVLSCVISHRTRFISPCGVPTLPRARR